MYTFISSLTLALSIMLSSQLAFAESAIVSHFVMKDTAGVKHNMAIKRGNIAQEILALANKEKFDLIVMGSKGRTGIMDSLMGSVAQKVSSGAKQAVLLIK